MNQNRPATRPLAIVDIETLILTDPALHELALAAGTPAAVRDVVARLLEAAPQMGQRVMLVVDPRYLGEEPRPGHLRQPGETGPVHVVVPLRNVSREQAIRALVATHAENGIPVEVVVTEETCGLLGELDGARLEEAVAFQIRWARALARRTADRIRAQRSLGDTERLVGALEDASRRGPQARTDPAVSGGGPGPDASQDGRQSKAA